MLGEPLFHRLLPTLQFIPLRCEKPVELRLHPVVFLRGPGPSDAIRRLPAVGVVRGSLVGFQAKRRPVCFIQRSWFAFPHLQGKLAIAHSFEEGVPGDDLGRLIRWNRIRQYDQTADLV